MNIIEFIERNYKYFFHRKRCIKIIFNNFHFKYKDIIKDENDNYYKSLGNLWFYILL